MKLDFWDLAATNDAAALFAALEAMVQDQVGAIIFSASVFDLDAKMSRRIHTNQPKVYPVSGLKPIVRNRWTGIVLDHHQTFVANRIEEIAEVFPDAPLIASLGCGSVVNMPVCLSGRLIGTVNLLHETGYYTPRRLAVLATFRAASLACFFSQTFTGT